MHKNIKKLLRYFIIFVGIIIILPTSLYLLLRIPEIQTFAVKRITNHLSNEIKSTISVGRVDYQFFNRLNISDLLIGDQNHDTLIYSQKLSVGIRRVDLKNKSFRFGKVMLINPVVSFITDSTGQMNLRWYLDMLKTPDDTLKKSTFFIEQIDISNARFAFSNQTKEESKTGIDFNNLNFTGINMILENFKVLEDTTSFEIYNLGFVESSGFTIRKMNSAIAFSNQNILLNSVYINGDSSILNLARLEFRPDSISSFERFTEEVKLDIVFEKSLINTSELAYFIPFANRINESIWLSGRVYGTISELRGRNIEVAYREKTNLDCDFDFSGLPNIENTFIYIGVSSLNTNVNDIEKFVISGKEKIEFPEFLYKLGNVSFDGSFTGFTTDFVTYGKVSTELGNIRTDISLRPEANLYRMKGLINGSNINLGEISGNTHLLGQLSMEANIDGYALSFKKFAANLTGKIDSVEINNYIYRNITLNGDFTEKTWDGNIKVEEENIEMDLLGIFNFSEELPEFNFTLDLSKANLHKLNVDTEDTTSSLRMLLTSNFKGNSIDNLDGEIRLLNSRIIKYGTNLDLFDYSIRTYTENRIPAISIRTDFAEADLKGYYSFSGLERLFKSTFARLMPALSDDNEMTGISGRNNFNFEINFKNTDKINNFFRTGMLFSEKSYISGMVSTDSIISLSGNANKFNYKNNILHDLHLEAKISDSTFNADISTTALTFMGQTDLKDFSSSIYAHPNTFTFSVDWDNKEKILNTGSFTAVGTFSEPSVGGINPVLKVKIDSSEIYIRNNLWTIRESEVIIDSNSVHIDKIFIFNRDHFYQIDGAVSENPADTLYLKFKGIDISPLNFITQKNATENSGQLPLNLRGNLNGNILLTNIYKDLLLETNLNVNNFSILNNEYGDISIISAWDVMDKVVNINADNNLNGLKMFDMQGYYDPSSKIIDLNILADHLPIGALNPLLKVFASDISGAVSGKVRLSGGMNALTLNGAVMAQKASLKVDYLQSVFNLNDTIRFDKNGIKFNNVRLTDEKGNIGTISGYVYHKNFKNYTTDLVINTNQFQVLNTKPKDNELFYGTAYATGVTTVKIDEKTIGFDISASTDKNTKFYIPLNSGLSVSDYSFITFIDPDSIKRTTSNPVSESKQTGMDLTFDLKITPDAEVKLIFDAKVGDEMTGNGSGDLNINLDQGNFKISGDYIIEKGDYLFTLGNILNKSFKVVNGGRISFNGDIDDAEIEITAVYGLTTSLYQILQEERYKERTSVEILLNLTGKLFNPVVKLDIQLPNADEETRTYLRSMITTEEELSRQFFYLLVMNNFLATSTSTTGTSAMAVTTTEMLSNQISNWLSQISNDVDLGFVYRPGNKNINSQELEVALSTQLLNDKVSINVRGTGTTGDQTSNTNPISGDFDAEVRITDRIRFKVFNRYNNPYTGKQADYTQGIGLFYRQEFTKFSDLFGNRKKSDMKEEEKIIIGN